ncbi:unnamed protein product [Lasius platythorax]|uniref:Uncharacterized protein n=1 Tax=Lasius platythorax TaxID=488582 RepID=A0AAV2N2V0_9HYME
MGWGSAQCLVRLCASMDSALYVHKARTIPEDVGNGRFAYVRQGKQLAFLCGSPTTNRFDVAVGRKISLLLRLPPGTRDHSLHVAPDFCHTESVRSLPNILPRTYRNLSSG